MSDLMEFLRACLAEDEADADVLDSDSFYLDYAPDGFLDALDRQRAKLSAEVAAKRAILDLHQREEGQHPDFCGHDLHQLPCPTLRLLAQPYIAAGRPGFDPSWRTS